MLEGKEKKERKRRKERHMPFCISLHFIKEMRIATTFLTNPLSPTCVIAAKLSFKLLVNCSYLSKFSRLTHA